MWVQSFEFEACVVGSGHCRATSYSVVRVGVFLIAELSPLTLPKAALRVQPVQL